MASSSKDGLDKFCMACVGPFRQPKMLPNCGHSFCLDCIVTIVGNSSSITCPECNTINIIGPKGPQGMKTNFAVERLSRACLEARKSPEVTEPLTPEKEPPVVVSNAVSPAAYEPCVHLNQTKSPRSCPHCGQKFCKSCEMCHKESIKLETLAKIESLQSFSGKMDDTLAQLERTFAEKGADIKKRIEASCEQLNEVFRTASQERKVALLQLGQEIADSKLVETKDIYSKIKDLLKTSPNEMVGDLPTKSVFHISIDELAKINEKVLELDSQVQAFEMLSHQASCSTISFKDDDRTSINLVNLLKEHLHRPVVKWVDGTIYPEGALSKLHRAIEEGSLEKVVEAIDQPSLSPAAMTALVETKDPAYKDRTALLHAVYLDRLEILKYLIKDCRANMFATCENGVSAAHLAASNGYVGMLRYLLECDRRVCTVKDAFGANALSHAAYLGHVDCCKLLLDQKETDIENQGEAKRTALLYAASSGRRPVIELLLERAANVEAKDEKGMTALHLASFFGYANVVRYLVKKHPPLLLVKDVFGQTASDLARGCNKPDVVVIFQEAERILKLQMNSI